MDSKREEILYSKDQLKKALYRLIEALKCDSDLKIDASIQRFEFTFELAWKTLKRVLLYEGHVCKSPRECLKAGFKLDMILNEKLWLDMLDDRNAMSHIYSEDQANRIFKNISQYVKAFQVLLDKLDERF